METTARRPKVEASSQNIATRESARQAQTGRPLVHLAAGAQVISKPNTQHAAKSGGLATSILTSPLDVLRTRLQSDLYQLPASRRSSTHSVTQPTTSQLLNASLRHFRETGQIIGSIYRTEGWRAFFRGLGPSLSGVVPATAIKFYVYGNCKSVGARVLNCREDAAVVHAQAAVAAGIATATATNPIWLVKTRLQLDASRAEATGDTARRYKNSLDCVRQVLRQEGVRGLYRGLSASYLGTAETALHLVLYEQFKLLSRRALAGTGAQEPPAWAEAKHWIGTSGAAGAAKFAAVLITYPMRS